MSVAPDIRALAVIGDARTTAAIGPSGTVELLCLPRLDETPVLARLLDPEAGAFELAPRTPGTPEMAYLRDTNVLQTRWLSPGGEAIVTDTLIGGPGAEAASTTLVRRVRCTRGQMAMDFAVAPRFGDGLTLPADVTALPEGLCIRGPGLTLSLGAADVTWIDGAARGMLELSSGECAVLSFGVGSAPLARAEAAASVDATVRAWRAWVAGLSYQGRWAEAVRRSALALRLLIRDTSGGIAAAGSFGLPEQPGGERNYDYRYCWVRDSSFVVDGLASIGARESARRYLDWLSQTLRSTSPVVQPCYRLDGGDDAPERQTALSGYRGANPVRIGNRAFKQRQLGSCGDLLQSCVLLREHEIDFPEALGESIVAAIEYLRSIWREPDAGIWETDPPRQHTWSKMASWIAFTRAADLADAGVIEGDSDGWRREAVTIQRLVETKHFSTKRNTYLGAAGEDGLDAAVLLGVFMGYEPSDRERWTGTLAAIDRELGAGPLLYRTTELRGSEQTFLPCAFWRAHALVRLGRLEEACGLLDTLTSRCGPLGLLSESAAEDGSLWSNVPQALTHAALINACVTYDQRSRHVH